MQRILVLAVLVGCIQNRTGAVEVAHNTEMASIHNMAVGKLVMPQCFIGPPQFGKTESRPTQDSGPSFHYVLRNGASVRQPCGMIVNEVMADAFLKPYIAEMCGGVDDAKCSSGFFAMFLARMKERYAFTDWAKVENRCTAYPLDCRKWFKVELWALDSHNDGVVEWASRAFAQANQKYAADFERAYAAEQADRRRIAGAIDAIGKGLSGPPSVHCTSVTSGDVTSTNCQ